MKGLSFKVILCAIFTIVLEQNTFAILPLPLNSCKPENQGQQCLYLSNGSRLIGVCDYLTCKAPVIQNNSNPSSFGLITGISGVRSRG